MVKAAAQLGSLSVITLCLFFGATQACLPKFGNHEKIAATDKSCLAKTGLTKTPPSSDDLMKPDFDDKGYTTCMLYGLELINEGLLERDNLMDFVDEHSPKSLTSKLTEVANKCIDSAKIDKVKAIKDTKVKNPPFSHFYGCFVSSAEKLC